MKQQKRRGPSRLISALLAMAMVLSLAPFAWAADTTVSTLSELQTALSSAGPGETITLDNNIEVSGAEFSAVSATGPLITIPAGVTLDGGGHTVSMAADVTADGTRRHVIGMTTAGTSTVQNLTISGNPHGAGVIAYGSGVELNLTDVTINDCATVAVQVNNGAKVTATDLTTSGNAWGSVNLDSSNMNAASFTLNSGTLSEGDKIYVDGDDTIQQSAPDAGITASGYNRYEVKNESGGIASIVYTNATELTGVGVATVTAATDGWVTVYTTLGAALAAANDGDIVTLTDNVTLATPSRTVPNIDDGVTLEVPEGLTLTVSAATALTSGADSTLDVKGTLAMNIMESYWLALLRGNIKLNPTTTLTYGPAGAIETILSPDTTEGYLTLTSGEATMSFQHAGEIGGTSDDIDVGYISLILNGEATVNQNMVAALPTTDSLDLSAEGGSAATVNSRPFHMTVANGSTVTVPESVTLSLPTLTRIPPAAGSNGSTLTVESGGTFDVEGTLEVHMGATVTGTIAVTDSGKVYDFGSTSPSAKYTLAVGGEVYAQANTLTVSDSAGTMVTADSGSYNYTSISAGSTNFDYKYTISTYTVTITVTDDEGTTVNGATVTLNDSSTEYSATGTSGTYTVDVPAGNYTVSVTYSDYGIDTVTVGGADASRGFAVSGATTVAVTLKPVAAISHTVSGTVTLDGNPVDGVEVTLTSSAGTYTDTTDSNGGYSVDVPAGEYTVSVVSGSGYQAYSNTVTVSSGDVTHDIALTATTTPTAPTLDGLTVSAGTLTPTFDAGTKAYNVTVPNATDSITVTPTATSGTITVNGTTVPSGTASSPISLNVGRNTIHVVVTEGGETTTYTITVNRENASTPGGNPGGNPGGGTTYPVNAPAVDNANVAANPSPAQPGQTVTVTVTPDEGYEASGVTVIGPGNVTVPVTDNGNGTYTFVMPEGGVTVNATVTPIQQPVFPFVDVPADAYYRQAVEYMYELGLIQGTSETTFGPMLASTRGQVVAILYRLEGSPAVNGSNPFVDATADWVQAAVLWASQNGIVEGYNDTAFGPDDAITREQLAAILYRYASYKSYDLTVTGDLSIFNDASDVATWSHTPLAWAVGKGLIQGSNDLVNPQGSAIRAQLALVLMRFLENVAV